MPEVREPPPYQTVINVLVQFLMFDILQNVIHVRNRLVGFRPYSRDHQLHGRIGIVILQRSHGRLILRKSSCWRIAQLCQLIGKAITQILSVQTLFCHCCINTVHGIPIPLDIFKHLILCHFTRGFTSKKLLHPEEKMPTTRDVYMILINFFILTKIRRLH